MKRITQAQVNKLKREQVRGTLVLPYGEYIGINIPSCAVLRPTKPEDFPKLSPEEKDYSFTNCHFDSGYALYTESPVLYIDCIFGSHGSVRNGIILRCRGIHLGTFITECTFVLGYPNHLGSAVLTGCNVNGLPLRGTNPLLALERAGSEFRHTNFYDTRDGIRVECGCFFGCLESFLGAVEGGHSDPQGVLTANGKAYLAFARLAEDYFNSQRKEEAKAAEASK